MLPLAPMEIELLCCLPTCCTGVATVESLIEDVFMRPAFFPVAKPATHDQAQKDIRAAIDDLNRMFRCLLGEPGIITGAYHHGLSGPGRASYYLTPAAAQWTRESFGFLTVAI